jgi:hypothetical protein
MPRFTLIKHGDSEFDADVTMEFNSDCLDLVNAHVQDFLQASGFEFPIEEPDHATDRWLKERDFLAKEEDWMWNDAFKAKFGKTADVIEFPSDPTPS